MGVEVPPNSAFRTIWTTAMDRYFIDLMLEQVGRGSRVDGHLFSKRAWRHMTLLFNEKFRLQYSRDHLKNRHKTLRRVYRAVKNLLEQNGFTWDETQHMVTADDCVWSNYTKVHPEARSYRTKSIPHYSDMCKIFKSASVVRQNDSTHVETHISDVKGTTIGGNFGCLHSTISVAHEDPIDGERGLTSDLVRTIDISELDEQQLTMPTTSLLSSNESIVDILHEMVAVDATSTNGKQDNTPFYTENAIDTLQTVSDALDASSGNRPRTYWQPPMDSYLIELMLEQVHQGNQFDGTFRKHAWIHITELFNTKFGYKYDMVVLKNRYKTLKRQYTAIKVLLDQKGIFWDDTRQMVTAEDHIWHDYVKVHPDAKQYITRPVPHYNDLSVIFKDVTADEGNSDPAYNTDQQNEVALIFQQSQSPAVEGDPINLLQESSSQLVRHTDIFDRKNKCQFGPPSTFLSSKKPRRKNDDEAITNFSPDVHVLESSHFARGTDAYDNKLLACQHPDVVQRGNYDVIANAIREMAAAVSSLFNKKIESDNTSSTEDVIHALQATPDIDDDLILDACDLFEDEKKAKTFVSLDIRLRKKWLMRKLR